MVRFFSAKKIININITLSHRMELLGCNFDLYSYDDRDKNRVNDNIDLNSVDDVDNED